MIDPLRAKLLADISAVQQLIRDAFCDVTLGDGVGLLQGQKIDGYADAATQAATREKDEKLNWSRIPADLLNAAHSSLSFFDAEGMRFHLPAYLMANLTGKLYHNIAFHLIDTAHTDGCRFSALTAAQRHAVHQFLLVHLDTIPEPDCEAERALINQAIADLWSR